MKEVDDFISSLRLGEPDSFGNLTVFPLFSDYSRVDGYTLLDEAINTKRFIVTEINNAGRVAELLTVSK
jgi:ARG and Rhodanese-Phosphatase-superfamily-associated Protein domain